MGELCPGTDLGPISAGPNSYHSSSTAGGGHRTSSLTQVFQGMEFANLCVDVTDKRILWNIYGHASCGRVLAIMGPSGSGKTTLLSTLAGHIQLTTGTITFNGLRVGKRMKRQISYVLQEDLFFPNLTLRETLKYSALLRLPREYSYSEKLSKVEAVIGTLGLSDCADTFIGNANLRGLSGGEKKRTSIACELLTDPTMLLLDEPTSGLDSSSALKLMQILCQLARENNKIVIASIHQPSSQLFHMFDDFLLLAKGKVAYFGEASEALSYFASRNLQCSLHYNPADYMLEMVTQEESRRALIGEDPVQETRPLPRVWWKKCFCLEKSQNSKEYPISPRRTSTVSTRELMAMENVSVKENKSDNEHESDNEYKSDNEHTNPRVSRKWPTPWHWQFLVLIVRTFRVSRHVIMSKLNILQTLAMSAVVSLIWFQVPEDEDSVEDRRGYFFFALVFWGFQCMLVSAASIPAEYTVISKERRCGSYHLSAYYLAKMLSELPLVVLLPSVFFVITYWCGGFNGWTTFFAVWFIILVNSLVAQSVGILIGAVFMSVQKSLVVVSVVMLGFMLLGGFYVKRLPFWFQWAQYLSFISYSFRASLEFGFLDLNLRCGYSGLSEFQSCILCSNDTQLAMSNCTLPGSEVVAISAFSFQWYWNICILIAFVIVFRSLAYLALRCLHKRKH